MNFGASDPLQDYQISEFGGVDFSTLGNKVSMARSPDAVNMMLNHNGYLEKRTGYRRLYQGDERINGIFDYTPKDAKETFYFMHAGTKLYRITFGENGSIVPGTLLMSDLKDVKSRHFVFNDRLYIIGCGYIQILYRNGRIECGRVSDIGTIQDSVEIGEGDCLCTDYKSRTVYFTVPLTNTNSEKKAVPYKNAQNLKIQDDSESIKIEKIYVEHDGIWDLWELEYVDISEDGKTISLCGNPYFGCDGTGFQETHFSFSFERIKVVYSPSSMVASPLVFINRTAVPHRYSYEDSLGYKHYNLDYRYNDYDYYKNPNKVTSDFIGKMPLDGDSVDAASYANGRRRIQFLVPESTNQCGYICYLTEKGSRAIINRIAVNGVLLQNYKKHYTFATSYEELHSDSYETVYIDKQGRFVCLYMMWAYNNADGTINREPLPNSIQPGDVIEIDFTVLRDDSSDDEQISDCSIYGIYGGNNDTRVFLSGNPKHKNRDYASGLYDATYFPNNMYTDVGSESSAIVGYQKLYSNQIIVKDDATEDASQYLRSLNIDESGNVTYTLIQGHSTYGGSCASSFKQVGGLPFYIGPGGAYTIAGGAVQNQNNTVLRSLQINKRFLLEDLESAVCCRFEDNYIVATGTHIWYCDTQHGMEWFYLEGLPEITCIWPHRDSLYFGTADGRVCVFSKREDQNAYYDNLNPDKTTDGAVPVTCYWCTPISAFDNWNMYKTIVNVYLSIMPHSDTSVHVYYNSSDDIDEDITTEDVRLFDFNDIDFGNFSFDGIRQPKPFATGVKSKNVYVFGVKLANELAQPFGIVSVGYKYKYSKYVK